MTTPDLPPDPEDTPMTTLSYDDRDEGWAEYDDPQHADPAPRRPRRQFFNRRSAALGALITCAAGFYAGVRIEKGQISASPSAASSVGLTGLAAAGSARPRTFTAGAGGSRSGPGPGGAGLAGFGGGGGGSFGQVSSVRGRTLYVTDASGNTIKIRLGSTTQISKRVTVSRRAVRPGDTVSVQGLKNHQGTLIASSLTDTGASTTSSSASGASTGASTGAGSGVSALFGGRSGG